MGDLDALLEGFNVGALQLPAPPAGALDPWTGTPILADNSVAPPPLTAPIELPLTPSTGTDLVTPADSATPALEATAAAATAIPVAAAPSGTPITREEVLELLEGLDATIYLMV